MLAVSFRNQTETASSFASSSSALGPLAQLHTSSHFAHDQLWHQLDLRNRSLLPAVQRQIDVLCNAPDLKEPTELKRRVTFASHSPEEQVRQEAPSKRASSPPPQSHDPQHQFFNQEDMDTFVTDAEKLAQHGKPPLSDEDADDASNASQSSDGDEEDKPQRYADFFDPPVQHSKSKAVDVLSEMEASDDEEEPTVTPLQEAFKDGRQHVEEMERESVEPKTWELRGEVSAFARPRDSLLETEMEHDVGVRPRSFVNTDVSEAVEDMIKQRIVDGIFDDVMPAVPEDYTKEKAGKEVAEVSQEKATEGLADVYAREFTEEKDKEIQQVKSRTVERKEKETETEEQQHVNELYERLNGKLDALCNLHFAPSAVNRADMDVVKKNVKAVAAEEAMPDGASDGDALAPHEVFSADKNASKGENERTKRERKARRRGNKNREAKRRRRELTQTK